MAWVGCVSSIAHVPERSDAYQYVPWNSNVRKSFLFVFILTLGCKGKSIQTQMIEPYNPPIHPSDSKPAGPSWSLASPDLQITCPEGRLRSNQARQTCGSPSPWLVSRFVRFLSRLPRRPVSCGRAVLCCVRGRVSDREASRGIRISSSQHESTAGAYIDSEILARNWRRSAHPYIVIHDLHILLSARHF
jgi:hypothetical protein